MSVEYGKPEEFFLWPKYFINSQFNVITGETIRELDFHKKSFPHGEDGNFGHVAKTCLFLFFILFWLLSKYKNICKL